MTRLPPHSRETERIAAIMVVIGSIIRAHLRGGSVPKGKAFDPIRAAQSLEAAGMSGLEPLPGYAELNPQSIAASAAAMPDEAAALAPQLTAASHRLWTLEEVRRELRLPQMGADYVKAIFINQPAPPDEMRNFSGNFSSHVKQARMQEATAFAMAAHGASKIIRRDDAAKLLGVSLRWFDHNIKRLLNEYAFPAPRDPNGQRRWVLAHVREWAANPISTTPLARARAAHVKTEKQDAVD